MPLNAIRNPGASFAWPRPKGSPGSVGNRAVMPPSDVRVEALRSDQSCSSARHWEREVSIGEYTYRATGRGSVPYDRIEIRRGSEELATVRAQWKRLPDSWILVSQEYRSSDGAVKDELQLEHFDSSGPRERLERPDGTCAAISGIAASDGIATQRGAGPGGSRPGQPPNRGLPSGVGTPAMDATSCYIPSDADLEAGECSAEWWARTGAAVAYVGAAATMYATCFAPEPTITKVTCIAAATAYGAALANLVEKDAKLDACKQKAREAAQAQCSCSAPQRRIENVWQQPSLHLIGRPAGVPGLAGAPATTNFECGTGGAGTSGDGSGAGGAGETTTYWVLVICAFEDYYDSNGRYLYSHALGCTFELMT